MEIFLHGKYQIVIGLNCKTPNYFANTCNVFYKKKRRNPVTLAVGYKR